MYAPVACAIGQQACMRKRLACLCMPCVLDLAVNRVLQL